MRRSMILLLAALASAPAPASAGGDRHYFVGAKLAYFAAFSHGETLHHIGGGFFFEASLVPHWLEIEVSAKVMGAPDSVVLPLDLLFKVPFHPHPMIQPFVGAGPALALLFSTSHSGETHVHGGVATVAGVYIWIRQHWAISIEANYNLLYGRGTSHEVGGATGVVFGW